MAQSKGSAKIKEGPGAVASVTEETPAKADTTSAPIPNDAKPNDPPVRTNHPDVPIAQVLASGAGAPERPQDDDPHIGADGRFYANVEDAKAASAGYLDESQ